jgi:hypothetical protein
VWRDEAGLTDWLDELETASIAPSRSWLDHQLAADLHRTERHHALISLRLISLHEYLISLRACLVSAPAPRPLQASTQAPHA